MLYLKPCQDLAVINANSCINLDQECMTETNKLAKTFNATKKSIFLHPSHLKKVALLDQRVQ